MNQVAEFISWKVKMDGDINDMSIIISEANNNRLIDALVDVATNPDDKDNQKYFTRVSVETIDEYLKKEGWYKLMAEDKAEQENPYKQDALSAYDARMGL